MSLSSQQAGIIQSLIPLLKQYGPEITARFYQRLFEAHPELLNIFNHTNQRKGEQQQALATAVYAAAANIDHLESITPVLKHVAHKHCSLGIRPEHYLIVGHHLTEAIQEIIGPLATEALEAWLLVYNIIANMFITIEQDIYLAQAEQHGGWRGFRSFKVTRKAQEAQNLVSLYLQPTDGLPLAFFQPGQYVSLKIHHDKYDHLRQYSLSDVPGKGYYRIAVKLEDGGEGIPGIVSTHIHTLREGDPVELSAPAGDFILTPGKTPVVLLAAGIGITPLLSMLKTVVHDEPQRTVMLAYAVRSGRYHAFKEELRALTAKHKQVSLTTWYEEPTIEDRQAGIFDYSGRISPQWLQNHVPHNAEIYVCGPRPFMQVMLSTLLKNGFSSSQFHYEVFGPALAFQID
jgi:nitric oxide dioxygenase